MSHNRHPNTYCPGALELFWLIAESPRGTSLFGEDEYGIWVAGAVRPDATEEQIRKLRASSISGDWRNIGGQLELVAALCVNQPGFPLAVVAHGRREALVAYGAQTMDRLKHPAEDEPVDLLKVAGPALARLARRDARERIAALN